MIEPSTVRYVSAALYVGWALALLGAVRLKRPASRRYCYPFVAVVGIAVVAVGLRGAGIGAIPIGAGEVDIPQLVGDYVAYPLLFGFAAFVAGASRRYIGFVVATIVVMRAAYEAANLFDGTVGLAGTATVVAGYALLVWLYFGPVAAAARRQPPRRALFYRKTRNLVLFVFGILISWAMLQLFGAFDAFTQAVTLEYIDFILRVGFAGFVIANAETLLDDEGGSDARREGDGTDSGTATVPTAD